MCGKLTAAAVITALCVGVGNAAGTGYLGSGLGPQIGLVILDDPEPVDVGFDIGGHADIAFGLGPGGELHYYPSLEVWMGGEDHGSLEYFALEICLNFFDVRYYFPVPVSIKPFVGLGPMVAIDYWDVDHVTRGDYDDDDWDADAGFNIFSGVDFDVSPSMDLYLEMRGKFGDWDLFKLMGGMTFPLGR